MTKLLTSGAKSKGATTTWADSATTLGPLPTLIVAVTMPSEVDRQRFDRMLAAHTRDCGVEVRGQTTVTACEPGDNGWRIGLQSTTGSATIACRFVVDATGRRASPLKRRAGRRIIHDRLIGIAAFTPPVHTDRRTLIEATAGGWWYSALLPGDRMSLFT